MKAWLCVILVACGKHVEDDRAPAPGGAARLHPMTSETFPALVAPLLPYSQLHVGMTRAEARRIVPAIPEQGELPRISTSYEGVIAEPYSPGGVLQAIFYELPPGGAALLATTWGPPKPMRLVLDDKTLGVWCSPTTAWCAVDQADGTISFYNFTPLSEVLGDGATTGLVAPLWGQPPGERQLPATEWSRTGTPVTISAGAIEVAISAEREPQRTAIRAELDRLVAHHHPSVRASIRDNNFWWIARFER